MAEETGAPPEEHRIAHRHSVLKGAKIIFDQSVIDCLVLNVSASGARVRTDGVVLIPERVSLRFSGGTAFAATRRWTRGMEIGLAFDGGPTLVGESAEMAWRVYEKIRATTIEDQIALLRSERFFDDDGLQAAAEEAEAGLRRLEAALASRARRSLR